MQVTKKSFVKTLCLLGVTATAIALFSDPAFASNQTLTDVAVGSTNELIAVDAAIAGGSYLAGIIMAMMGLNSLKAHVEDAGQNPLRTALAQLGLGGSLLLLPAVVKFVTNSAIVNGQDASAQVSTFTGTGTVTK